MNHLLRATDVDAPFSSVIEYVGDFLREHPRLKVKAVASSRASVDTRFAIVDDGSDTARLHDALTLEWRPDWPLFPRFSGFVTVRPQSLGSLLELQGSYEPPAGRLGQAFDALIGERLAYGTMDHLLGRLCRYVERRHRDFLKSRPTIEELNAREVSDPGVR
ncbi:MAG: hypothetical protein M3126_02820 [Candidatus Eremiobacteraeota bacterium]|nr:hypothetical protein [Candidatus Eremiobacteraeota bacterium]